MKTRVMLQHTNGDSVGDLENQPSGQGSEESSQSPTPLTNTPAPSPTDDAQARYIATMEATLREQNRTIQKLVEERPAAPVAVPPARSVEDEKQDFYNDPVGTTQRIIDQALERTVKPLVDGFRSLRFEGSPYDVMMSKFKADPRYSTMLADPAVQGAVAQIMNGQDLSEQLMQSAIVHAIGLKAIGQLGGAPAPTPTPTNNNPTPSSAVMPPHVQPSAAPVPQPSGNRAAPVHLTEQERRLYQEGKAQGKWKSEAEYVQWRDMDASEVAHSTLGMPVRV